MRRTLPQESLSRLLRACFKPVRALCAPLPQLLLLSLSLTPPPPPSPSGGYERKAQPKLCNVVASWNEAGNHTAIYVHCERVSINDRGGIFRDGLGVGMSTQRDVSVAHDYAMKVTPCAGTITSTHRL